MPDEENIFSEAETNPGDRKAENIFSEAPKDVQQHAESVGWFSPTNIAMEAWKSQKEAIQGVGQGLYKLYGQSQRDPREGMGVGDYLETGKALGQTLGSAVAAPFAAPMGAARSLIGQPMAKLGELYDKAVSSSPRTQAQIYEEMGPGIDTALGAIARRPRSLEGLQGPSLQNFEPIQPREKPPGEGPIRSNLRLLTEEGQKTRAGQTLEKAAENPEALRGALENRPSELVPGSEPTLFQETGDMGIGNLERAVRNANPEPFNIRRGEQNAKRLDALESAQKSGNPELVAEHLKGAMNDADRAAETTLRAAGVRAWDESHGIGGHENPSVQGNQIRQSLRAAENSAREVENSLWNAIDPEGNMVARTGPVRQVFNGIYENMGDAARTTMKPIEQRLVDAVEGYGPSVPFREMTELRSAVSSAMREEKLANGSSPAYGRLVRLRTGIEEAITNDVMDIATGEFTRAASERLRTASGATRARAERFNARPVKDILRRDGLEGVYSLGEGSVPGKITKDFDSANRFLTAVGVREGVPVLRDTLAASMRRAATDQHGNINPERLQRWAAQNQDALRAVDQHDGGAFSQSLRNVGNAARSVADAAEVRAMIEAEHKRGIFGRLVGANERVDINRIIGGVFDKENSVQLARSMRRRMTTPESLDAMKRSVAEHIMERFISNTEAGTSEQNLIRADQFQTFMKKNVSALNALGFTPEQLKSWQGIASDIRRANRSIVSSKIPGGSNTPQDLYALKENTKEMGTLGKLITYGVGAAGGALSSITGGIAGLIGAHFAIGLRDAGVKKVQDLVLRAMLDPGLARELLQKAKGPTKIPGIKRWSMYQAANANQSKKTDGENP